MKFLIKLLSSGLFTGYIPKIPGTASTIVYAFVYYFFFPENNQYSFFIIAVFLVFSVLISSLAEKLYGKKDDQRIVIDEIAGIWIGMIYLPKTLFCTVLAILFFRIFDIKKPFFIKKAQKIKGGLGIVIDDVLAGIFTNITLQFIYAVIRTL